MRALLCVCLIAHALAAFDSVNKDIILKKVEQSINLESQLIKISSKLSVENTGRGAVKSILVAVEESVSKHLAFIQAQDENKESFVLSEAKVQEYKNIPFFKVQLNDAITPGATILIHIESVVCNWLEPFPHEISQSERQLVRYRGNHYYYSPYPVRSQITNVQLSSNNIESYTKLRPVVQADTTITYGPYENVQPFTQDEMVVHFENNQPFLAITSMTRLIEVSHWGNIAVEEVIDVRHTGAKLKGPFSRYEFQREQNSGQSSVRSFKTLLPASASDVYYRDEIGNISTSNMRNLADSVELDLRPRFPLFGGWKTRYTLGYNLPSYEYLFYSGEDFALKMRFLDHVFDDMIVDELYVKIILPEGCSDIRLETEYPVTRLEDKKHYTYLDFTGRPVITAVKRNLVENHIQDFELYYKFPRTLMFLEPFLVITALFLMFLVFIVYVRLDFSITKDEERESRMRVGAYCEKIQCHHDRRLFIFKQYEETINKFKQTKDTTSFTNSVKNLHLEHKTESAAVQEIYNKIKSDAPNVADRVTDIQKIDKAVKELIIQQINFAEKLVAGKMNKSQYVENENNINKKKDDMLSKMTDMVAQL